MIIERLAQAQGVLSTYTQFRQDHQQTKQLDSTLEVLKGLHQLAETFVERYRNIVPRLDGYLPLDFDDRILALQQKIVNSHNDFATSPWQVNSVNAIQSDLKKLLDQMKSAWTIYATQTIQPKQELYGLLKELPEVRRSSLLVERMLRTLDDQTRILPTTAHDLERFDDQLNEVTLVLTNVEGITDVVSDFLFRVHQGTFTIADLSDEILAWCRINNRGASFKIRA